MGAFTIMKILVTGAGSGFIGGKTVQRLEKGGHEITVYGHNPPDYETSARYIRGDILSGEDLSKLDTYDVTVHLAGIVGSAKTFGSIKKTVETNIIGTLNILDRHLGGGVVIQANLIGDWLNPYMISKKAAERFGLMYGTEFPMKYISLRLTDVFGPRQSTAHGKAVPTFITKALRNESLPIYGSGNYEMRLFYVDDVADVIAGVVEKCDDMPTKVDVGSLQWDNRISVKSLAMKIIRLTESSSELEFLPMRRGQPKGAVGYAVDTDQSKWLFKELGVIETPHDPALKATIDWYRQTGSAKK
jgi:nucleoside-diphosphate-sugar epimerase